MSGLKKIKKSFKSIVSPKAIIGSALGGPIGGIWGTSEGYKDADREQDMKNESRAAQQMAEIQAGYDENLRRKNKQESMNGRITGISSLIGGGGTTLG